ncbi:hypothetical protein GGR93_000666 [Sulfitobacter noctilucicola]|uniref:Uncharacterized protein n=1 Tax=Sulfitobacter noctilucicola TaxID=1342301 RepID=A0A7W6M5L4_9RHOB|nr:hypothetical protein [Sulfitobacter noctilucicola]
MGCLFRFQNRYSICGLLSGCKIGGWTKHATISLVHPGAQDALIAERFRPKMVTPAERRESQKKEAKTTKLAGHT